MAQRIIAGKDVFLYKGTIIVGCATSASLTCNAELLEAACKSSGGWGESVAGTKTWSMSLEGVYKIYDGADVATNVSVTDWWTNLNNDETVSVKFGTATTGDMVWSGTAFVTSWELTGADAAATYSLELTGTGALTMAAVA